MILLLSACSPSPVICGNSRFLPGITVPCPTGMEVEPPALPPDVAAPASAASRKRNSLSSDSEATLIDSTESDDSSDDDYVTVLSQKAKRRMLRASVDTSTMRTPQSSPKYTILFLPVLPSDNMRFLNRQVASVELERLLPNSIEDVRVNPRKNIVAVDVAQASALDSLRAVTVLGGMNVRTIIPMGKETTTGVIYDIDAAISGEDLPLLIKPANHGIQILQVARLGTSRCVKIVFKGDCLPSHVKVGHFRHAVRPFVPKPLQCRNCQKFGHVSAVCGKSAVCSRCAAQHSAGNCQAKTFKCPNCQGPHDASSKECPRVKRELSILKKMVRDRSTHREAAADVRRRRSRRRRSSRNSALRTQNTRAAQPLAVESAPTSVQNVSKPRIDNGASQKNAVDEEWPPLPRISPVEKPQQGKAPQCSTPHPDQLTEHDRRIVTMLKSLIDAIRTLVGNSNTPTARSAVQVLDALSPVLANLA